MFVQAQAAHGAKGLQFVGIAVDDALKVRQFAKEIGLNYPSLIGGYGAMELSKTLGNTVMALPFTIVIGPKGNVVHTQLGPFKRPSSSDLLPISSDPRDAGAFARRANAVERARRIRHCHANMPLLRDWAPSYGNSGNVR